MTSDEASTAEPESAPRATIRPRSLVAGLGLIGLWWYGSIGAVLIAEFTGPPDSDSWTALGMLGFWTLVVSAMLRACWRGGPISWWFLSRLSSGFGVIILAGGVLLGVPGFFLTDEKLGLAPLLLLPLVTGGILFAAGYLLRREDARRWCQAVPGTTTPPA